MNEQQQNEEHREMKIQQQNEDTTTKTPTLQKPNWRFPKAK